MKDMKISEDKLKQMLGCKISNSLPIIRGGQTWDSWCKSGIDKVMKSKNETERKTESKPQSILGEIS